MRGFCTIAHVKRPPQEPPKASPCICICIVVCVSSAREVLATCDTKMSGATVIQGHSNISSHLPETIKILCTVGYHHIFSKTGASTFFVGHSCNHVMS